MFVHLRLHTEFSVVDGTNRIDEIVKAAQADNQPALGITDLNNAFGAIKFYKEARGKGLKPVVGCEMMLQGVGADPAVVSRVVLLVQNHKGYLNLCELLARAWTRNVVRAQAVCKLEWLQELNDGLLLLSGAQAGPVGQALLQGDESRASDAALQLAAIFPHRFYLELQRAGRNDDEARVCISEGEILGNQRRVRKFTREQYFKTQAQMEALFADLPSAIANTLEIARRCNLVLVLGKPQLPNFPTPNGMPAEEYFRFASHEGLNERLLQLFPKEAEREAQRQRYVDRLEF